MDCKATSTKRRAGFSLTEMMVTAGIGAILLLALGSLLAYTGRSYAAIANYADLDKASRNALDTMSQQIRQTSRLKEGTATRLLFEDYDGADLEFIYSSSARTLVRNKSGQSKVLLKNCDDLTFSLFQRNPIGGSYNVYPTATAATCKLVQLRWTCSRDLLKSKVNTESVQSSKIVIRKQ